jgi:hypothetical protein
MVAPPAFRPSVRRSSQVSAMMKTVAPAKKAVPALHAPPCSKASSKSSKATAVISAPEAKASSAAVSRFGGGRQAPIHPPSGSALDAISAKMTALPIQGHYSVNVMALEAPRLRRLH